MANTQELATVTEARLETTASRLRELVSHLRQQRAQLREEWARLITEVKLLTAMTEEEISAEAKLPRAAVASARCGTPCGRGARWTRPVTTTRSSSRRA